MKAPRTISRILLLGALAGFSALLLTTWEDAEPTSLVAAVRERSPDRVVSTLRDGHGTIHPEEQLAALEQAARMHKPEILQTLLQECYFTDEEKARAFGLAAAVGDPMSVQIFINSSADVNSQEPSSLYTPLHYAALAGNAQTVQMLLAAGADAKLTTWRGMQARDMAEAVLRADRPGTDIEEFLDVIRMLRNAEAE